MSYVKHGMYKTPEYSAWTSMKQRCFNPNKPNFYLYGGRGISVCAEWDASFEVFYEYIGPRPSNGHSLDRIDVNGHYEPGNVRWATADIQAQNRRPLSFCKNGLHEMTEGNVLQIKGDSGRRCKACIRARRNKGRPTPQPCGTPAAYRRHFTHGETPCDACRVADGAHRRARRAERDAA